MWSDLWYGWVPCHNYPESFSFSKLNQLLYNLQQMENIFYLFPLPLSVQAFQQLIPLLQALENNGNSEDSDIWMYIWGSALYSSSKAYKFLHGSAAVHPSLSWLWKLNVQLQHKHKVFFWLLLKDKLSTRGSRKKIMALPSYSSVLCGLDIEEIVQHLFLQALLLNLAGRSYNFILISHMVHFSLCIVWGVNWMFLSSWISSSWCVGVFGWQEMIKLSVTFNQLCKDVRVSLRKNLPSGYHQSKQESSRSHDFMDAQQFVASLMDSPLRIA